MKLKHLFTVALATLLFACTNTNPVQVVISGTITNPKGDTVKIMMKDTSYITTLNEAAYFNVSFNLDTATYLSFFHGEESTGMYLKGGESVNLTIDTEFFDETISYEGSTESSYLAKKYLLDEEINIYEQLVTTEQKVFSLTLNKYIDKLSQELSTVNNEEFVKSEKEKNERDFNFYTKQSEAIAN